ncbi:ABC transporter ATP-binding protein [Conexibacter stalactiti]|uniref:ABC transporter ATP-binding protein n=1 Tax=Conexibacter stalactiti TaxID=1940611 RepID=A0ABU4HP29_9ACTN|nr:ABC transporter ATP-binding protein [Conexibacter stalactiti]MDW5595032.1 ABC transporter ATP-binding protein [Conexibacter stalactiti]MEC5035674.1 ABC transporter ATP-binding protein [Conexibacter stalactiti]
MATDAVLEIEGLDVAFDTGRREPQKVLEDISLTIPRETISVILGPSGCGKSTLLNVVAGLVAPTSGRIVAARRERPLETAYVFQNARLLPWLTVRQNIEFALQSRSVPKALWKERVEQKLELVGLTSVLREYPLRLSGGMQQRVGIARALAVEPDLLLMDEPFSHLDEISAKALREETVRICQTSRVTVLFITHDMSEAAFLADTIYMMRSNPGRIAHRVDVTLPRPRSFSDPALYELQGSLATEFYDLIDAQEERHAA